MELWQMDVMGRVRLSDGTELSVVTGIDDHSRFCVIATLVRRATAKPVCEALAEALHSHGVPDAILMDNGKVFTGRFGLAKGPVLFDRICVDNGIRHLLTAPYSPTTTGKVERLHKTMRAEFFALHCFDTIEEAQAGLDAWVEHYNTERPHQGIGGRRSIASAWPPSSRSSWWVAPTRASPTGSASPGGSAPTAGSAWLASSTSPGGGWPAR